jgi:hypothetical protein
MVLRNPAARRTRKILRKPKPIQFEEFATCIAWWNNREENENAWCIPAADILIDAGGKLLSANLDRKNPNGRMKPNTPNPLKPFRHIGKGKTNCIFWMK